MVLSVPVPAWVPVLGFILLTIAIFGTGQAAARMLYRRFGDEEPSTIEGFVTAAILGLTLWLAVQWILTMTFSLTARNVLIAASAFAIVGLPAIRKPERLNLDRWSAVCAIPIAAWSAFVLWRGYVVPPVNHDLMTYHLPKAVLLIRARGLEEFSFPDPRIRTFPANYELLLADLLLLSGDDRLIEWISVITYLLFVAVAGMYARRWWGAGRHVAASMLVVAASAVLLIHSGHAKNDLLTGVFAAVAVYWSARWCTRGGVLAAMLAILCGVAGVGTKLSAAAIVIGVAPFGLAALLRRPPSPRALGRAAVFAAVALILCGGWVFVVNATASGPEELADSAGVPTPVYGDWRLMLELPFVITRVSLGLGSDVPWTGEHWPWLPYDLFGPHLGPLMALCAVAVPIGILRHRRLGPDAVLANERLIATAVALIAFAVLLPIVHTPRTAAQAVVRYAVFILPVCAAWTIAPLIRSVGRYAPIVLAVLVSNFVLQATLVATEDAHAPLSYATWCARNPGTRRVHTPPQRAAAVADAMAGANETIAVSGSDGAWIYPAYGANASRHVEVFTDAARVPPGARYIAVDHIPLDILHPAPRELRMIETLSNDPRYQLVYHDKRFNQAVFRRR